MKLYKKTLKKISNFQSDHPYFTVIIIAILSLAMISGAAKVRTVASLEQMMPKDVEEIKAFNTLRDNNIGQDTIAIVLELDRNSPDIDGVIDIRDERVFEYINNLENALIRQPDVLQIYSFAQLVRQKKGSYEQIIHESELDDYVNHESTLTMILINTDVSADDPRMNLLSTQVKEIVESMGHPPGVKISYTGTPVIQQRLGELISKDRNSTRWISTFLVFAITMIIFASLTSAVMPILVVTVSVTWLYGTMGYANLPISTLAGGVAAMVIGIGIDFAIHIMNKYKYERAKNKSINKAVESSIVETGTALTATSLTTIAAFLAFLSGQMPEMGRFGILMAIGITYSLIFSLFGLPALLIIEEKISKKLKRSR